jgi:hypothetical protein
MTAGSGGFLAIWRVSFDNESVFLCGPTLAISRGADNLETIQSPVISMLIRDRVHAVVL